jgi:hypothetical protein
MFRAEAFHRSNVTFSFDGLKVLVWFLATILPWMAIYVFGHRLLGISHKLLGI